MSVTKFAKQIIAYTEEQPHTIIVMIDEKVYRTQYGYSIWPLYMRCIDETKNQIIKFTELLDIFMQVPSINITTNRNRIVYKNAMNLIFNTSEEEEYEGHKYFPYDIQPICNPKDRKIYEQILPIVYDKIKEYHEQEQEQFTDVESFI